MSKELEALTELLRITAFLPRETFLRAQKYFDIIEPALQRLETIYSANPSEFNSTWLDNQITWFEDEYNHFEMIAKSDADASITKKDLDQLIIIKNYILKAQEQEKEIAYIEKIKTMMKQKDCALRYIESEDCFAVKTILSDGWYKLTPEFVENNVREEIKPSPLIEKNKQLKEENAEYKIVLEIIKNKRVDMWHLVDLLDQTYEMYLAFCKSEGYDNEYILTEEEFDLVKRYCNE